MIPLKKLKTKIITQSAGYVSRFCWQV